MIDALDDTASFQIGRDPVLLVVRSVETDVDGRMDGATLVLMLEGDTKIIDADTPWRRNERSWR